MTVTQQNSHLSVVAAVADPRQERLLRNTSRFDRLPQNAPTPASEQKLFGLASKPI
ncbi:MAG TPA: carbohydrate ABC transporter permease, partial [Afipia sp.]|nr:carbohydrate ABC transporter permease [Afipia sp.]